MAAHCSKRRPSALLPKGFVPAGGSPIDQRKPSGSIAVGAIRESDTASRRASPWVTSCRMLKKASRFVLSSLRGSTYRRGYAFASRHCRLTISPARTNMLLLIRRSVRLAAAVLEVHFEHHCRAFSVYPEFDAHSCFTV